MMQQKRCLVSRTRRIGTHTCHSDYKGMKPYFDIVDSIKVSSMTKFDGLI